MQTLLWAFLSRFFSAPRPMKMRCQQPFPSSKLSGARLHRADHTTCTQRLLKAIEPSWSQQVLLTELKKKPFLLHLLPHRSWVCFHKTVLPSQHQSREIQLLLSRHFTLSGFLFWAVWEYWKGQQWKTERGRGLCVVLPAVLDMKLSYSHIWHLFLDKKHSHGMYLCWLHGRGNFFERLGCFLCFR